MNYNNPPSKVVGGILKTMGLLSGVADLSYLLPDGKIMFIELKSAKGVQSPTQKAFEQSILSLGGTYKIARDIYEFMGIINAYNP